MRQRGQENGIPVPEINISALSVLNDYPFNGNIRELRNIVERSLVICSGNTITRDDLLKALYPQDLEDTSPLPPILHLKPPAKKVPFYGHLENAAATRPRQPDFWESTVLHYGEKCRNII